MDKPHKKQAECIVCSNTFIKNTRSFCCCPECQKTYRRNYKRLMKKRIQEGYNICRTCGNIYVEGLEHFEVKNDKYCPDFKGYRYCCKECMLKGQKHSKLVYYHCNKEYLSLYKKEYYRINRNKILEASKQRYEAKRKSAKRAE